MSKPVCGNDPRAELTDGDRAAVDEFREYLRLRKAAVAALPGFLAAIGRSQWRVYCWDADQWLPVGTACESPEQAHDKLTRLTERHPHFIGRVLRETVTYSVEERP